MRDGSGLCAGVPGKTINGKYFKATVCCCIALMNEVFTQKNACIE